MKIFQTMVYKYAYFHQQEKHKHCYSKLWCAVVWQILDLEKVLYNNNCSKSKCVNFFYSGVCLENFSYELEMYKNIFG